MGKTRKVRSKARSHAPPSEYELKIDEQAEKFVDRRQKLTYFLITASVAVIAFLVAFMENHGEDPRSRVWIALLSSISGLMTAGFSLFSLRLELQSYRLHVKSRYERKGYEDLSDAEKEKWDEANAQAARYLQRAFSFLVTEITLAVAYFVLFFA